MNRFNTAVLMFLSAAICILPDAYPRNFTEKDHPDTLLDFDKAVQSASEVTCDVYPDADDVLVDDYVYVTYNADGTSITTDDTYVKVLTEKGKRSNKTMSRHFNQVYGSVEYLLVEVIKPDGTRRKIDIDKNSSVAVSRGQMSMNIYNPNRKVLTVSIPNLEISDTIHYIVRHRTEKARVKNTWADLQVFEYTSPIKHYIYEIQGPAQRPLKSIALKDPVPGKITSQTKTLKHIRIYRWEVKDMPRMFREPRMPSLYTVAARLLVSTASSWEEISRWYYNLSEPHLKKTTDKMKTKVAELVRGRKTMQEKIEAVFYYVSQEVRYMGLTLEKESPGYEPHDVSITFKRKYGVCRDKAALLASMLNLAGIEAYPVLIHTGPKKDEEVPLPYFNHAITAAADGRGGYILMDSTSDTAKELFPTYLSDSSFLVATPQGDPLRVSPITPASENMVNILTSASLAEDGSLSGKTELAFGGINDGMYRRFLINSNPERRKRLFERIVQNMAPGATVKTLTITPDNFMDMNTPLQVTVTFTAPDVTSEGGSVLFLDVPVAGTRVGAVNFILKNTGLEKRKYPFRTGIACGVDETVRIDLGTGVGNEVSLPDIPPVDRTGIEFRRRFLQRKRQLTVKNRFCLNKVEFSPDEYLALKDILKDIEYASRKRPIFKTAGLKQASQTHEGSDALILEDSAVYTLKNRHEWTERIKHRKRILTHLGKKWYAELKIDYNTAWDEFKLINAQVIHPDGTERKVKAEEINIMDAGWVSRAPRYPKSVTAVVSFPGVSVGSIIEYEYEITRTKRPFFCIIRRLQDEEPLVRKTVTITCPKELTLTTGGTNILPEPAVIEKQGTVSTTWTVSDIDRIKGEPARPPLWTLAPSLIVSAGDWETYRKDVQRLIAEKMTISPGIQKRVIGFKKKHGKSDLNIIQAIRNYVMKTVRIAGPPFTRAPLSSLTSAQTTITEGYGSRADTVIALAALLETAGYNPEIVLVSPQSALEQKHIGRLIRTPNFKHVFSRLLVRVKPGSWIYLGDTGQYAELGSTRYEGRLAVSLAGDMEPFEIRTDERYRSKTKTVYTINLSENGDAEIIYSKTYRGIPFSGINKINSELTPENRRRRFREKIARISQSAQPLKPWKVNSQHYPAKETFSISVPRFAVRDGIRLYFTLPETIKNIYNTTEKHRVYPYMQQKNINRTIRTEIIIPTGWSPLMLPPRLSWKQPLFSGSITSETAHEHNRIIITQHAHLTPTLIRPADYESVKNLEQLLQTPKSHTIMLKKKK